MKKDIKKMKERQLGRLGYLIHDSVTRKDLSLLGLLKSFYIGKTVTERIYIDKVIRYGTIVHYSERGYNCSRAKAIMREINELEKEVRWNELIEGLEEIYRDDVIKFNQ